MLTKWCSHCCKTDHNDPECWSTRGMNEPDPFWFLSDADRCGGDDPRAEVYNDAWMDAALAFQKACNGSRGHAEWCEEVRAAVRVLAAAAPKVLAAEHEYMRRLADREPPNVTMRRDQQHAQD